MCSSSWNIILYTAHLLKFPLLCFQIYNCVMGQVLCLCIFAVQKKSFRLQICFNCCSLYCKSNLCDVLGQWCVYENICAI